MELVNHTPVPADLRTSPVPNTLNRRGWLTATATYRFDTRRAELDRDHPFEVLTSDEIDNLISRMKDELGITFIVISHDIVGTFAVADRIAMLYNGDLVASGTPEQILHTDQLILRQFLARNMELPTLPGATR